MTAELEQDLAAAPHEVSPWRLAGLAARQRRRRLLLGVVVVFTLSVAVAGVPTGREWLTFWLLLTLFAACGGAWGVFRRAVVRDWLPLLAVLFAYDLLRGVANEIGGRFFGLPRLNPGNSPVYVQAHMWPPIDVDRFVFGGTVPTVWLQKHFYDPGVAHWYDRLAIVIYMSHFLVSLVLAIALWCVNYPLFRRYIAALVALTSVTLATYVLFPAAPPWMAGINHAFPAQDLAVRCVNPDRVSTCVQVHRVVQESLQVIGGSTVDSAVEKGAAYSNSVAAMPSLHAAIPMMLLVFFWPEVRRRGKLGLSLYAFGMSIVLVYGGEHYVTDVVMGWLYALGVVVVLRRFFFRTQPEDAPADNPLTTKAAHHHLT